MTQRQATTVFRRLVHCTRAHLCYHFQHSETAKAFFTLVTHGSSLKPTTQQTCQRIGYRPALRVYVLYQMRLPCLLTIVELVSSLKPALKITQSGMAVNWSSYSQRWAGCSLAMLGCSICGGIYADTGSVRFSCLPFSHLQLTARIDGL